MKPPSPRLAVFCIVLLDVMGFGLIIPSQPFLAKHFGATATLVTLLGTTYSLAQFLLAPMWGSLSDRYGRKPILLATITMTAIGHAAFAASTSLTMLFLARALAGTGAANISTAQAVLADTHEPAERSRAMAIVGIAFGVGFVLGPALGGLLFQVDHRAPAACGALLAVLNLIFVLTRMTETRKQGVPGTRYVPRLADITKLEPNLRRLIFTTFLFITAFALMEQSVGLFIEQHWTEASDPERMKVATHLNSIFLIVVGITAIFAQGFLVRRWLKTVSELRMVRFGLCIVAGSLVLIPILGDVGNYTLFLVSGATLALGSGMFNPSMAGLVSLSSPSERQGFGLSLNQSAAALGRIVGPTTAGYLFSTNASAPFFIGAVLVVVALGMFRAINQIDIKSAER
jgi:DHA1 family tetracycline resistance protein-like MFS transporter